MAHYAFLDKNNIVVEVIVGKEENEDGIDWEKHYENFRGLACKRTSYNTQKGIHKLGGIPFRKNYACIGYKYDAEKDAFIPPKPFNSWVLDETIGGWIPPVAIPSDHEQGNPPKIYIWDEPTTSWKIVE